MSPEQIAMVCHETNRAYCAALGDTTQLPWELAPEWQRASAVAGVLAHQDKPRSPRESHELWLEHKKAEGWAYGPVKDPENRLHPCFVPYDALPPEQRVKDMLFSTVVLVLLRGAAL